MLLRRRETDGSETVLATHAATLVLVLVPVLLAAPGSCCLASMAAGGVDTAGNPYGPNCGRLGSEDSRSDGYDKGSLAGSRGGGPAAAPPTPSASCHLALGLVSSLNPKDRPSMGKPCRCLRPLLWPSAIWGTELLLLSRLPTPLSPSPQKQTRRSLGGSVQNGDA